MISKVTTLSFGLVASLIVGLLGQPAFGQTGNRHAILIGGLGGEATYTERFSDYLADTRMGLVDHLGFEADNVIVLGEPRIADQPHVTASSDAETIRSTFADLGSRLTAGDVLYVFLFGHGSSDGTSAVLNIPRRDLTDADYRALLDNLNVGQVVFINTASASGPFIEALSAPERVVLTATRRGSQRNETVFPRYLVEALNTPEQADLNKDGNLSVRELFVTVAQRTGQHFEAQSLLATENALLDDNGDAEGTRLEELEASLDGAVAARVFLGRNLVAAVQELLALASPAQSAERDNLLSQIASAKARKAQLDTDAYYAELETLFVRLAQLNDAIESSE